MNDLNSILNVLKTNHYVYMAAIGFGVGLISRVLLPGPDPMGIFTTMILGIAGSFVGAFGANYLGIVAHGTWPQFFIAVAGAIVLLAIYRIIRNV